MGERTYVATAERILRPKGAIMEAASGIPENVGEGQRWPALRTVATILRVLAWLTAGQALQLLLPGAIRPGVLLAWRSYPVGGAGTGVQIVVLFCSGPM